MAEVTAAKAAAAEAAAAVEAVAAAEAAAGVESAAAAGAAAKAAIDTPGAEAALSPELPKEPGADASSPGFTVTDSISIWRQGWYLETSPGTSDHE
jgi:hypothetical protein